MANDRKQWPFGQYQYVDVSFGAAATDTPIPLGELRAESPDDVRWIDVTPGAVDSGGDQVASIYRSGLPSRTLDNATTLFLRSSVANYSTRLLLFVERT